MNVFYTPHIEGEQAFLEAAEAHHAVRVLRKRAGDELFWVDGRGCFYRGVIEQVAKKSVHLRILSRERSPLERPFSLHLAVAPPKNIARFEWMLEKATEIGVERITPLLCARSERKQLKPERLHRLLIAAMKQSGRARLPILDPMLPFGKFLNALQDKASVQKFIAHCVADDDKKHLLHNYRPGRDLVVLIGPEGDFSPEEVAAARANGFLPVHLGQARLRTETAGVVVAALVAAGG